MAKNESKAINKKEKNSKDKTSFFKSFKAELKKVSWPTPKQLINNTMAVVVIVIILSAIVFVLDFAFEAVNKYGIDKVKETIITSNEEQTVEDIDEDESVEETEVTNEDSKEESETKDDTNETSETESTIQVTETTTNTTETNETTENNQ